MPGRGNSEQYQQEVRQVTSPALTPERMQVCREAFDAIYPTIEPILPRITGLARRMLNGSRQIENSTEASDIQQLVLLRAFANAPELWDRKQQQLREGKQLSLPAWLMTTTRNLCYEELRKKGNRLIEVFSTYQPEHDDATSPFEFMPDSEPLPEEQVLQQEQTDMLQEAIASLSESYPRYAPIFTERLQGNSLSQAAANLSLPSGTVSAYTSRLTPLLRKELQKRDVTP